MSNIRAKADVYTIVVLLTGPWLLIALIIVVICMKSCIPDNSNSIDDSINKSQEIFQSIIVADSTHNGFTLVYVTTNVVTQERLEEMRTRKHIIDAFNRLKAEAPTHFGNMLETDIYDFADFAIQYDSDSDITLHQIFVYGSQKQRLYIGANPKIPNSATWLNVYTEQGTQYLKQNDIYYHSGSEKKTYYYWKCQGLYSTSSTDERYSHFSEDERLW